MFRGVGVLAEHFRRPRGAFAERRILLIDAQLLKLNLLLGAAAQQKARSDAGGCEYLFHCCDSSVVRGGKSPARRLYAILPCIITAMLLRRIITAAALALCAAAVSSCGGKAAVDAKDYSLHEAAATGDVAAIKRLVAGGADVNRRAFHELSVNSPRRGDEWSPLHYAAANNREEAIYTLINSGAEVNLRDTNGDAPLHLAAHYGNADAAAALVRSGANLNMQDNGARKPLEIARKERGGKDTTAIFLEHAAKHHAKEAERKARQLFQRSKKPVPPPVSPFVDCADWAAEVLGDDGKPAEHLELTNSCLIMKSTGGFEATDAEKVNAANVYAAKGKYDSLHEAAKAGDVAEINRMVADGADFNQEDSDGRTPLRYAVNEGHAAAVDALVKAGVDVRVDEGELLEVAAENGHVAVIDALINAGANANSDAGGRTPLHGAAQYGHVAVINALVKAGANVNQGTGWGWTPLHFAANHGHIQAITALVKYGADVNRAEEQFGETPLYFAVVSRKLQAITALIEAGADVNWGSKQGTAHSISGRTPLHDAVSWEETESLLALIKAGANVNQADDEGRTPLHVAAQRGNASILGILIKAGANVNQGNNEGRTPLREAMAYEHAAIVDALIKAGADTATAKYDSLYAAAEAGDVVAINAFVKVGVDVNKGRPGFETSPNYMIWGQMSVVSESGEGPTPLYYAAENGHAAAINALFKAGAYHGKWYLGQAALHTAAENGHADAIDALIKGGAYVDDDDIFKRTPLYFAATNGHVAAIDALVKGGADVNRNVSNTGAPPLYFAAINGHAAAVDALVRGGASVNQGDNNGVTPLHIAAYHGHASAAAALVKGGANLDMRVKEGYTPLQIAIQRWGNNAAIVIFLQKAAKWRVKVSEQEADELVRSLSE